MRMIGFLMVLLISVSGATQEKGGLSIELQTVLKRDDPDDKELWFHPRVSLTDTENTTVMTVQKLLGRSDHYSGLSVLKSTDNGKTWSAPALVPELGWTVEAGSDKVNIAVADVTPGFHAPTETVLAVGAQVRYSPDGKQLQDKPRSHQTAYATMNSKGEWKAWQRLEMPAENREFDFARSACAQWLAESDGSVLLPFYIGKGTKTPFSTTIVQCDFDGEKLTYRKHGNILRNETMRGLYEPSLVKFKDLYFLTMRNDQRGYVSVSDDGLDFAPAIPWTFDDGEEIGSYNTQQHWLELGDKLYLVYTRRGADNDHIMRHRAPLFIAQVNVEKLQLVRSTEQIAVPERGATLGNFGVVKISDTESWISVGEGNVNAKAQNRGADGSLFLARVRKN